AEGPSIYLSATWFPRIIRFARGPEKGAFKISRPGTGPAQRRKNKGIPAPWTGRALAPLEGLLEVLHVARVLKGILERQVSRPVELVERLVHRLHPDLPRHLDDGVDLVGLVL